MTVGLQESYILVAGFPDSGFNYSRILKFKIKGY